MELVPGQNGERDTLVFTYVPYEVRISFDVILQLLYCIYSSDRWEVRLRLRVISLV